MKPGDFSKYAANKEAAGFWNAVGTAALKGGRALMGAARGGGSAFLRGVGSSGRGRVIRNYSPGPGKQGPIHRVLRKRTAADMERRGRRMIGSAVGRASRGVGKGVGWAMANPMSAAGATAAGGLGYMALRGGGGGGYGGYRGGSLMM